MTESADPRDRLIVALDLPGVPEAEALIDRIGDAATFYKIGYRLGYAGGLALAERLAARGLKVFLDLKLHDIGNTVEEGVRSASGLGATFLTVHAYPQTMRAAVRGRGASLKILAVTVLTSYDDADAAEAGYALPVDSLARRAIEALREGKEVEYGFLGVALPGTTNRIGAVEPGTPAGEGGMMLNDEIVSIGGIPVVDSDSLVMAVNSFIPGTPITPRLRSGSIAISAPPMIPPWLLPS